MKKTFCLAHLIIIGFRNFLNVYTYIHTGNANQNWIGGLGAREKGRGPGTKREKGKSGESFFRSILTLHTAARTTRTKRNDFPVGIRPPTSDIKNICIDNRLCFAREIEIGPLNSCSLKAARIQRSDLGVSCT